MLAESYAGPAPSLVRTLADPPPGPLHHWKDGRFWVGPFLVPEQRFVLRVPCPACGGSSYYEEGEFRCLLCARELMVDILSSAGQVVRLAVRGGRPPVLVKIAPGQERRTARWLSKRDGSNGLCARVLRLLPRDPGQYAVVEMLAGRLSVRRDQVKTALAELHEAGLITRIEFARGYRTGWRRTEEVPQ